MGPLYPVALVVEGRRCLVVGGGRVAVRKVEGLVDCGARVTVVAPDLDPGIEAMVAEVRRRRFEPADLDGMRLVIAATDDAGVNATVSAEAERRGVWANAADQPDACSFTLPSVHRQGPITVAVATAGRSPAFAGWLRRRLGREVGPEYAALVEMLNQERAAIQAAGRSTEGLDWLSALDSNMLDLIRAGQLGKARERLQACLSSS